MAQCREVTIRVNAWTVCRNENKVVAVSGGSTVISFTPAVTLFFSPSGFFILSSVCRLLSGRHQSVLRDSGSHEQGICLKCVKLFKCIWLLQYL